MQTYNRDQVQIVDAGLSPEGDRRLRFTTPLETAWYCPGLSVVKDNDRTVVRVVRCRLNSDCSVTHPISQADSPHEVILSDTSGPIFLEDETGLLQIAP